VTYYGIHRKIRTSVFALIDIALALHAQSTVLAVDSYWPCLYVADFATDIVRKKAIDTTQVPMLAGTALS
jgi:hypothetical protein